MHEIAINAFLPKKFFMSSHLFNTALVDNDDPVGSFDRTKPMSD